MPNKLWQIVIIAGTILGIGGQMTLSFADHTPSHPGPKIDEIWTRTEQNMGIPSKPPGETPGEAGVLDGDPWLQTRARKFVNIKKEHYLTKGSRVPNGIQISSSFNAETPSHVTIHFSAEAYVETLGVAEPADRRMFVRALLDGKPAQPSDVVFATGPVERAGAFVFTADVGEGIHTAEIQWKVDSPRGDETDVVGRMRDASLLVRQGSSLPHSYGSHLGYFEEKTAPSGGNLSNAVPAWVDVPDMSQSVRVASASPLVATFSSESWTTGSSRMGVRALVDGAPMQPFDIVFAKGGVASRAATFVANGLSAGVHSVKFQWRPDGKSGAVYMGERSMALAGFENVAAQPDHPAAVGGGLEETNESGPVPGMSVTVAIPERGNGEVAAIFTAEVAAVGGPAGFALAIDGQLLHESAVDLLSGEEAQARSWVFDVKDLSAGEHEIAVWWLGSETLKVLVGDRTLAVVAESGAIPDLAEAAHLGMGKYSKGHNISRIEAVIGRRPVLTILWDAERPEYPNDITTDELKLAFGRVAGYFGTVSSGRFQPVNAGVLGPYESLHDQSTHYWNHPKEDGEAICQDGFDDGAEHRRSEAVRLADAGFDFSAYDSNNDGRVDPDELAIVVVYKEISDDGGIIFGQALGSLAAAGCPDYEPLVLDGVTVGRAVDWFVERPSQDWIVMAHELGHHQLGLDDAYYGDASDSQAHRMDTRSLMGGLSNGATPHLSPAEKLALGWVTPEMVLEGGVRTAQDVKLSDRVDVLPRWNSTNRDEYLLVENRQSDLGWGKQDDGLGGSGFLVWHVAEDRNDNQIAPIGSDPDVFSSDAWDTQARSAIRLLRPFTQVDGGVAVTTDSAAGWHAWRYDLLAGACPAGPPAPGLAGAHNVLAWADCTASPYSLRNWSPLPLAPDPLDPKSTEMSYQVAIS